MYLFTAIKWFFKILFRGEAAFADAAAAKPVFSTSKEPALQLLGLLQKEGRFLDFLREDIGSYGDADVGAAVREMHRGWRKVIENTVKVTPVLEGREGDSVALPEGFDPSAIELRGEETSSDTRQGRLVHAGYRCVELTLPTVPASADPMILAPAQVEVR